MSIFFGEDYTKGVDLSGYTSLVIDADYFGDVTKLRIFMRNFNSKYSSVNDDNSAKYISLVMASRELAVPKPIRIKLDEFSVADWWLEQHEIEREFLPLEFSNVTILRFDFSEYMASNQYLTLRLKKVYFEGPLVAERDWYLGILTIWLTVGIGYLIFQFTIMLQRSRAYRLQIIKLASDRERYSQESQKYQALSHLDPLTKVFNRLGLENQFKQIGTNESFRPTALIVLDIDHFKRINDRYGHTVGDDILIAVTKLLNNNIRQHDVLARWGGEEFVLVFPHTNLETAFKLAEKLRQMLADHSFEPTKSFSITCSFGATIMHPEEDFDTAFQRADQALYQAKNQGRNCTVTSEA